MRLRSSSGVTPSPKQQPASQLSAAPQLTVEESYIALKHGFTVKAFALNVSKAKLAVLRHRDVKTTAETTGTTAIEFYSVLDTSGGVFLECTRYFTGTFCEAIAWIDDTYLGCAFLDGTITIISPFLNETTKQQVAPTPLWCVQPYTPGSVIAATDSGDILLLERNPETGSLETTKTVRLGDKARPICLATCPEAGLVALGSLDFVYILDLSADRKEPITIPLNKERYRSTVAWSLHFFQGTLFVGDSRGFVTIYSATNGALIKQLKTHEAPILTICSSNNAVYASGVDFRVQCLKCTGGNLTNWKNAFQFMVNDNDVRAMVYFNEHVFSGGAGHEIVIYNFGKRVPASARPLVQPVVSGSTGLERFVYSEIDSLTIFERQSTPQEEIIPRKITAVFSSKDVFEHFAMSPNGHFVAASLAGGDVRVYAIARDGGGAKRVAQIPAPGVVSAVQMTNDAVYLAAGDFGIYSYSLKSKKVKLVFKSETKVAVRSLIVTPSGRKAFILTQRMTIYFVDLKAKEIAEGEPSVTKLSAPSLVVSMVNYDEHGVFVFVLMPKSRIYYMSADLPRALHLRDFNDNQTPPIAMSGVVNDRMAVLALDRVCSILTLTPSMTTIGRYKCGEGPASFKRRKEAPPTAVDRFAIPASSEGQLSLLWAAGSAPHSAPLVKKPGGMSNGSSSRAQVNGTPSGKGDAAEKSVDRLFIFGFQPAAPPTQVPFAVKRFGLN